MQAPGGIGEQHVAAAGLGRLQRIEHHRAGVGAGLLRGEGGAGALRPYLQLLDRGGAEGVAGGEQHALAVTGHSGAASLPMVVVLPEPFTPTTRITNGRRLASITSGRAQGARICDDARAQRADERLGIGELLARHAAAQLLEDAPARLHADVGADQPRLELIEDGRIDLAAPQQVREVDGEPGIAAVQAVAQAAQESRALVGGGFRWLGGTSGRHCSGQKSRAAV